MKNKKIIICSIVIAFLSSFIMYFYKNPIFVLIGEKNQVVYVNSTHLDLHENHLKTNEEKNLIYFKNLEILNLRGSHIENLYFLKNMNHLLELQFGYVSYCYDSSSINFKPLESADSIISLSIIGLSNTDISFLTKMKGLEKLELSFSNLDNNMIKTLSELHSLKELNLSYSNISSMKPLNELNNLEILFIENTDITDVEDILIFSNLIELHLCNTKISNISQLSIMKSLKKIYVTESQYSNKDLEILKNKGIDIIEV